MIEIKEKLWTKDWQYFGLHFSLAGHASYTYLNPWSKQGWRWILPLANICCFKAAQQFFFLFSHFAFFQWHYINWWRLLVTDRFVIPVVFSKLVFSYTSPNVEKRWTELCPSTHIRNSYKALIEGQQLGFPWWSHCTHCIILSQGTWNPGSGTSCSTKLKHEPCILTPHWGKSVSPKRRFASSSLSSPSPYIKGNTGLELPLLLMPVAQLAHCRPSRWKHHCLLDVPSNSVSSDVPVINNSRNLCLHEGKRNSHFHTCLRVGVRLKSIRCSTRNCTASNSQLILTDFSMGLLFLRVAP